MKTVILSVVAAVALLTTGGEAEAKGHHSHGNYHVKHGKKFSHGYYYHGNHHQHWTKKHYFKQYGGHCYWCPSTHNWYYWSQSHYGYYPVNYYRSHR